MAINILIVEDHAIVREGIKGLIAQQDEIKVVAECADAEETLQTLQKIVPDLILCDINLPDMDGIELISQIKKKFDSIKIIILSSHTEEYFVLKALDVNADGYLHKNILKKELVESIKKVHKGEKYFSQAVSQTIINNMFHKKSGNAQNITTFTQREKEILKLITEGLSNKGIAEKLFISVKTVETHRTNLLKKAEAKNTAELVKFAITNKLV